MILADDPAILYSPYNWDITSGHAKTINAGAYFRVDIIGPPSSLALKFNMAGVASPVPKLTWEMDGGARQTVDLAATVTIPAPTANTWGRHLLTVTVEATSETVDRWQTQATATKFTGIDTTATAAAPTRRPLNMLILGDSITEGVRTLNRLAEADTGRNSSRHTWSYQLGPLLDAEVGVVGFGGTGVGRGGSGNAPAIAGFWNRQWQGGPSRNVLAVQPDYIVINMGTNDPDDINLTAAYIATLNAMLDATTTTRIFCLRPFEGTHGPDISAAVAGCSNPSRCTFIDTAGWWSPVDASDNLHPYGYVSPALARLTATAIKAATGSTPAPMPEQVNGFYFDFGGNPRPMSTIVTI